MRRQNYLYISILGSFFLLILASTTLGTSRADSRHTSQFAVSALSQTQKARALTLTEAWDILVAYAQTSQSETAIADLYGVDHPDDVDTAGHDGRRRAWQARLFEQVRPENQIWISLVDGAIIKEFREHGDPIIQPLNGKPVVDSVEVLSQAQRAKPEFHAMQTKGKGFHFGLVGDDNGTSLIVIRGSHHNRPAIISFNSTTGELQQARSLALTGGGILYSEDAGTTWNASNLTGTMVNEIAVDPMNMMAVLLSTKPMMEGTIGIFSAYCQWRLVTGHSHYWLFQIRRKALTSCWERLQDFGIQRMASRGRLFQVSPMGQSSGLQLLVWIR